MPSPDPSSPLRSPHAVQCGPLRVVFWRQADRFAHRVELVADDHQPGAAPLLVSVEGAPTDQWPPSPPLQQLQVQPQPDGSTAALLVGMAGRSHWSLSVAADLPAGGLVFDVACRLQSAPSGFLGSTYCPAPIAPPTIASLFVEPLDHPDSLPLEISGRPDRGRLAIRPLAAAGHWPATIRWRYAIRLR